MTERVPIGQRVRFEVFKRDSFTCQYCGAKAPDVVLQVDHIRPVAAGGDNDLMNLVTSCRPCNGGKGARPLSDDAILAKQREQMEELQERRHQLEMLLEWRNGLHDLEDASTEAVNQRLIRKTGIGASETGKASIRRWLKKSGLTEVLVAVEEAFDAYLRFGDDGCATVESWRIAFAKVGAFLAVRAVAKNKELLPRLAYIQGILKNRFDDRNFRCVADLDRMVSAGVSVESLEALARLADDWTEFTRIVDEWIALPGSRP